MIEDAIRGAAGRKHVSLSRLARDAHVQRQTIYNWFVGAVPEPETWDRVAKRLDLPALDVLLGRQQTTQTADPLVKALVDHTAAVTALAGQVKALVEAQTSPVELAHALGEAVALAVREASRAARDGVGPPRP